MPNTNERRQWTADGLKKRITGCSKKIGEATRNDDDSAANILRERRSLAMRKLAEKFDVWTLINPEGQTEFVDRAEWEQRMIAWGRRNGQLPRAQMNIGRTRRPTANPEGQTARDIAAAASDGAGTTPQVPPVVPPPADQTPPAVPPVTPAT